MSNDGRRRGIAFGAGVDFTDEISKQREVMARTGLGPVPAHPGDFVWRAWAAPSRCMPKKGYRVKIVCLAFGERGESQLTNWETAQSPGGTAGTAS